MQTRSCQIFYFDYYYFTSFEGLGIFEPWFYYFASPGFRDFTRPTSVIKLGTTYDFATTVDYTITIELSNNPIRPSGTGGTNTTTITIRTNPATPNQSVTLTARAAPTSGGHINHTGTRPTGSFSPARGMTNANGIFQSTYTASEFGGTIFIDANTKNVAASGTLNVFVNDLSELGALD